MPFLFEKYESAIKRPNGRPVGVRNGQGERAVTSSNPALDGMKHAVEGARDSLLTAETGVKNLGSAVNKNALSYARARMRESSMNVQPRKTLAKMQEATVKHKEYGLKQQTSTDKALESMSAWLDLLK